MNNQRYLNKVNNLNRVNTINKVNSLFTCLPCLPCLPTYGIAEKTDAPHLHFEGFHPLETGKYSLHMIMNHGNGRDK